MPHANFDQIVHAAHVVLDRYGYAGVFALVFAENVGLPLPGETILIAAILLAAKGEMRIVPVAICACLGCVTGGFAGFAVGRYGGHRLLLKYGSYVGINAERLSKVETFFGKYGGLVILLGRFFAAIRPVCAILAGCIYPSWRKFIAYNTVGATLWVGFWTILVLWLGRHTRQFWGFFRQNEPFVLVAITAIAALAAYLLYLKRRRAGRSPFSQRAP